MPTSPDHQERMLPDWLDYDPAGNYVIVDGFKISRDLLTQITTSPPGIRYRIIERKDGCVTVGYERDPLEAAAPDMLAALRELQVILDQMAALHPSRDLRESLPDPAGLAIRLRAVIAKAGEPL